ncbi:stage II sporulation protein M [Persicobacter diffluens]|uniref:Membrane protein n=1 Tax=Persicobacter diffluens TaxID=981 RepID=A0AAN4VXI4_9BACT|nr:membrane protein [Persicobacter diffluens]
MQNIENLDGIYLLRLMKEATFIFKNRKHWNKLKRVLKEEEGADPDQLSELYVRTNDDLAYSRTFYPKGESKRYLNQLLRELHYHIYRSRDVDFTYFIRYWWEILPTEIARHPIPYLTSFTFFFLSFLIGIISSAHDGEFVRVILGDSYVNMTLDNIANGDPMAVYKSSSELEMVSGITVNNIMVSFNAFTVGIFACLGTLKILFHNGVMLGAFQGFLLDHIDWKDYFFTVWLHGTLEISAIVIAGGAGIQLGASWLFPGDRSRLDALKKGGKSALVVIVSLIPVFMMAGFIEGVMTRHTEWSYFLRAVIVSLSAIYILVVYIIRPISIFFTLKKQEDEFTTSTLN